MNQLLEIKLVKRVVRRVMGALTHVRTDTPVVALTFDDGPHPDYTPRLLDILDQYQAKATFFVLGENARQYPEILKRMAQAGHVIGNHTHDHPSMPMLNRAQRRAQLNAWAKAVAPYGSKLFRPPYGNLTFASNLDVWSMGYRVVAWNVLARDWERDGVDNLVGRIASELKPGCIVLLHDALQDSVTTNSFDREDTLLAVEKILYQFQGHYRFVTVPELMRNGRPQVQAWDNPANVPWLNTLQQQQGEARRYSVSP